MNPGYTLYRCTKTRRLMISREKPDFPVEAISTVAAFNFRHAKTLFGYGDCTGEVYDLRQPLKEAA